MNNLILVRHGQSLWNLQKRFTGWANIDLTEKGKSEAKYAGKLIKDLNIEFDAHFTSLQKRAINTIEIILDILGADKSNLKKSWKLNERHYGDLTGLNKNDMMKKHGDKQIHIWRRSFNIAPPPIEKTNPNFFKIEQEYKPILNDKIPNVESLEDTFERVVPYYNSQIEPLVLSKKNILISAHGNSLRALCKKIFNISNKNIIKLEIPTGNPLHIIFGNNLEVKDYKYLDNKRAKKILFNV